MSACVGVSESSDESSSSSSDDEEEGQEGEEEVVGVIEWRPTGPDYALGDWEKHTTVWQASLSDGIVLL